MHPAPPPCGIGVQLGISDTGRPVTCATWSNRRLRWTTTVSNVKAGTAGSLGTSRPHWVGEEVGQRHDRGDVSRRFPRQEPPDFPKIARSGAPDGLVHIAGQRCRPPGRGANPHRRSHEAASKSDTLHRLPQSGLGVRRPAVDLRCRRAVLYMNCQSPVAPAPLRASGFSPLSRTGTYFNSKGRHAGPGLLRTGKYWGAQPVIRPGKMGRRRVMKAMRSNTAPWGARWGRPAIQVGQIPQNGGRIEVRRQVLLSVPAYQMALSVLTQWASSHHAHHSESTRWTHAESGLRLLKGMRQERHELGAVRDHGQGVSCADAVDRP